MPTRGFPPKISRAAVSRAPRWFWISQSRVYLFGAAIRRSSPSSAARRHGRSQESRALAGNRRSSSVSMRSHKESSISGTLDIRGAGSYTQSYPQMWITVHGRGFPGRRRGDTGHEAPGSDLSSARSAVDEGELVLHRALGPSAGHSGLRGCSGARESARYHRRERGRKRVARLDLPGGRSVDYGGSTTERGPHEENVSAECPAPEEDARIPRAHEDPGRSKGAEATPGERAKAADCLAGRGAASPRCPVGGAKSAPSGG